MVEHVSSELISGDSHPRVGWRLTSIEDVGVDEHVGVDLAVATINRLISGLPLRIVLDLELLYKSPFAHDCIRL